MRAQPSTGSAVALKLEGFIKDPFPEETVKMIVDSDRESFLR